jgi:predicted RNase H-like nuclease (RuvC/YqgF family)
MSVSGGLPQDPKRLVAIRERTEAVLPKTSEIVGLLAPGWVMSDRLQLKDDVLELLVEVERITEERDRLEKRLRHSEFHRAHNRRSMRERGKEIAKLSGRIERQREALRSLNGGKKLTAHERAAELHSSLRSAVSVPVGEGEPG